MNTTSFLELGNRAFSQGNYHRALDYYQKAFEGARGDPDLLADLYGNIGNVYGASGQVEQAVVYYQKAVEKYPESHYGGEANGLMQRLNVKKAS